MARLQSIGGLLIIRKSVSPVRDGNLPYSWSRIIERVLNVCIFHRLKYAFRVRNGSGDSGRDVAIRVGELQGSNASLETDGDLQHLGARRHGYKDIGVPGPRGCP